MKQRTATITFHSAHNYGSMLQAFALQHILEKNDYFNIIINLRTERQIRLYKEFIDIPLNNPKSILKRILITPYKNALNKKYELFERFLKEDLNLSKEYSKLEELENENFDIDCFISGGDQIWNTSPCDFDWSFYLPFTKGVKCISYAVSMGPKAERVAPYKDKISKYLSNYSHISVREQGTANYVQGLVDIPVSIELDPTMLLDRNEWFSKFDSKPMVQGDYILLYVPGYRKVEYDIAAKISKILGIKVVVTIFSYSLYKYPFEKQLATGPWEFLNLVKNAKLVVSGSFHALVFSTLFHTPFFAVNGDKDNRMITFLKNMNLNSRTINNDNIESKCKIAFSCDFREADHFIEKNRETSINYLMNAIEH